MIPSLLARHLRQGLSDYLRTTFPIANPGFEGMLDRFLEAEGELFRGPYISIGLPFVQAATSTGFFQGVPLAFPPYAHQEKAFRRLTGPDATSTLVATGTGSGKTESFLLPVLEHCWVEREKPGIKAILIYPMNALATDQAKRLAQIVHDAPKLRGKIRAGLWVGDREAHPRTQMDEGGIITDKERMLAEPPDILLTNYKMLDILLNRPKDQPLWGENAPETLRFIVVDELHTFDGAQGTDLACLLRRLKARLKTPPGHLVGIGTSATLGGSDAADDLRQYAQDVFGEPFDADAIVGETREDVLTFLTGHPLVEDRLPSPTELQALALDPAQVTADLFFETAPAPGPVWAVALGEALKGHHAFRALLQALDGRALSQDELLAEMGRFLPVWTEVDVPTQLARLETLLALVALARVEVGGKLRPFVHLRVQLWLRELRRMVASIEPAPALRFSTDLDPARLERHLPVVHCRECGQTGWAAVKRTRSVKVSPDLKAFYQAFFNDDPDTVFLFPDARQQLQNPNSGVLAGLCPECLALAPRTADSNCSACDYSPTLNVFVPYSFRDTKAGRRGHHDCPTCDGEDALTIVGLQAASITSVLVGQLFAARLNDDKKLLTFSDSVQDASHRAGFFAARTHTFGLRTAIAQYLATLGNTSPTLAQLPADFIAHWRARLDPPAYISQFLAPDLTWLSGFEQMKQTGQAPDPQDVLWTYLDRRVAWEIASELGWRARIGRTLEKSGLAIARVAPPSLEPVVEALRLRLGEEYELLRDLKVEHVRTFLLGLVRQLRVMGALALTILDHYVEEGCQPFVFKRFKEYRFLPALGPNKRPRFVASSRSRFLETIWRGPGEPETWFQSWALKCWNVPAKDFVRSILADALGDVFKVLTAQGLLVATPVKDRTIWALKPQALDVVREVAALRCTECRQAIAVGADEAALWQNAPCPRKSCDGHLEHKPGSADYYGDLYRHGDLARIFAAEHTGLLDRDTRESVESEFMSSPPVRQPWFPNLLSCTPTLEMGIDIGDLSTVALCSMPPGQANYLQRIGRAGRRDGNALALTVANARPHDLYFFADPKEMLQGRINPPGVFLGAAAVLERQLTAYCLDQWVATGVLASAIPSKVRQILPALKTKSPTRFPFNFLTFVQQNEAVLLAGFLALFDPPLEAEPITHLTDFIAGGATLGGPMRFKLISALERLTLHVESLQKRIRRVGDLLTQHLESPTKGLDHEERRLEFLSEKEALQALVRSQLDRDVYGFLTDEGLLPNYAFPEAGVELHSLIYRKKEGTIAAGSSAYDKKSYRYERPARTALGELAPSSHFYAEGRRVLVDQVDFSDSNLEAWRFCPECQHGELIVGDEQPSGCPRCASPMWADAAQKRELLRMRQVYATTEDRKSRAGDERDDRETSFFERQLMVNVLPGAVRAAFRLADTTMPFGFEFLSRAEFRDINFGERDPLAGGWNLAGQTVTGKGFKLCRHCGKVQSSDDEPNHTQSCTAKKLEAAENFVEVVYLYREFSSEALRLLLPVASLGGGDREVKSFTAALYLGLRRFYHGAIDHLQVTAMDEPDRETGLRKRFLVLYDSVPGGTGYLKQLATDPAALTQVLTMARDHIRSCACGTDPDKDGCYRCVYAYRHSRDLSAISRSVALEMLTRLLELTDQWVSVPNLHDVDLATLSESVLEERFLARLREAAGSSWRADLLDGRAGFTARFGQTTWQIAQQVELGPDQGVQAMMRADFMLTPQAPAQGRPIVVFTDGFAFHRDRLAKDLEQRTALLQSGRYLVWSLSFWDVEEPDHQRSPDPLLPSGLPGGAVLPNLLDGYGGLLKVNPPKGLEVLGNLAMLLRYLAQPDEVAWTVRAFAIAASTVSPQQPAETDWIAALEGRVPDEVAAGWIGEPAVLGQVGCGLARLFVRIPQAAMKPPVIDPDKAVVILAAPAVAPESQEAGWNALLRALNVLQFLSGCAALAPMQCWQSASTSPAVPDDPAWLDALALTDAALHPLLERLRQVGLTTPEPGYDIAGPDGRVVGSAEIAWPGAKVALLVPEELAMESDLQALGWHCLPLEPLLEDDAPLQEVIDHVCQPA